MRVAIYLRVSTNDGSQDTLNQRLQIEHFVAQKGWNVCGVYEDHRSGKNSDRKGFQRMFADAAKHKFDVVVFWSLDRFSREGSLATQLHLKSLADMGIKFYSYSEPYLNTTDSFVGDILIALLAALAKQERVRLSERTIAGLERAKASGEPGPKGFFGPGKPKKPLDMDKVRRLRAENKSYQAIADLMGVSKTCIIERLRAE